MLLAACGRVGFDERAARDAHADGMVCTTCDQGLIARWRLDETSGSIAHDDIGGHDATLQLASSWDAPGKVGSALSLEHGYAETVWDLPASAPDAFTVAMWVKIDPKTQPYDRYFSSFFYVTATGNDGALLMDNSSGDGFRCAPYVGGSFAFLDADHVVTIGAWQHLACLYDGQAVTEYVQAAPVGTMPASGTFSATTQFPIVIGGSTDGMGNYQNEAYMVVDDVRVYNRALTQAELTALASP